MGSGQGARGLGENYAIAGCKFDELSWETGGHGLLTKAFLDIVNASDFQICYDDLLNNNCADKETAWEEAFYKVL